jgi:hypothetical protein
MRSCLACGSEENIEEHHPFRGLFDEQTISLCERCHTHVDRMPFDRWLPGIAMQEILRSFSLLTPTGRIAMIKILAVFSEALYLRLYGRLPEGRVKRKQTRRRGDESSRPTEG